MKIPINVSNYSEGDVDAAIERGEYIGQEINVEDDAGTVTPGAVNVGDV